MMNKELCYCGKMATWIYMPGFGNGSSPFVCDDCVGRGCSCNNHHIDEDFLELPEGEENIDWKWVYQEEKHSAWTYLDENKREYPCCEYFYEKEGFEIDD